MYLLSFLSGTEAIYGALVLIAIVGVFVMYLLSIRNLLEVIAPHNRTVASNDVWLMLIPIFNLVYQFILVGHVADSIEAELRDRNQDGEQPARPTYDLGIWQCGLRIAGIIPVLGPVCSLASLIVWIIYWAKLSEWKNRFMTGRPKADDSLLDA